MVCPITKVPQSFLIYVFEGPFRCFSILEKSFTRIHRSTKPGKEVFLRTEKNNFVLVLE